MSARRVELVRKETDAAAEERPQAVGFAKSQEVQDVQAGHEILDVIEIAQSEPLEERAFELHGPQRVGRRRAPVRKLQRPVRESRDDRRVLRVSVIRTGLPGLRSTGISASMFAASRSVVPERGNSTRSARASRPVTRPIPSSGLKRCVR